MLPGENVSDHTMSFQEAVRYLANADFVIPESISIAILPRLSRATLGCLLTSLENDIVEMMDKPRTEVDLDKAIALGQEILAMCLPDNPRRSASLRKLINCVEERFQKQDAISDLDDLVALHQNILELQPPDDQVRSSLLHDLVHCLWRRFLKQGGNF